MALVIGVREGGTFRVGDVRCTVEELRDEQHFKIKVHEEFFTKVYEVTSMSQVEIMPKVFVSAGKDKWPGMASLSIEAPKHITILRERLYEKGEPGNSW